MARARGFNKVQAEQAGKYFLDLSKITFSIVVLGMLISSRGLVLGSVLWYIGIVGSALGFILGMHLLRTKRRR